MVTARLVRLRCRRLRGGPVAAEAPRPDAAACELSRAAAGDHLLRDPARRSRAFDAGQPCRPGSSTTPRSTGCPRSRDAGSRSRRTGPGRRSIPTARTAGSPTSASRPRASLPAPPLPGPRRPAAWPRAAYASTSSPPTPISSSTAVPALASDAWVVGGGSGHGFKHAPVIGEYVSGLVTRQPTSRTLAPPDDRFALRLRTAG